MFNYDKVKEQIEQESNQWASYSDLFMVLSFVFLLLYVTSSLRNGTFGIQKHIEYKQMEHELADLKEQLRVYNTLKEDYLENGADQKEQASYENLMDQLDLLQTEADQEAAELAKRANAHKQKKKALNKYQQMVRNIINSNMIANSRIKKRDNIIVEKEETIKAKEQEIAERKENIKTLEKEVAQKQKTIQANKRKIDKINKSLDSQIAKLKRTAKKYKTSKKKLNAQIRNLTKKSKQQIAKLSKVNKKVQSQLSKVNQDLSKTTKFLSMAEQQIEKEKEEKARLARQMKEDRVEFAQKVDKLKESYNQQINDKQNEYENQLSKLQSNFKEKYKSQSAQYEAYLKEQEKQYQQEMQARKDRYQAKIKAEKTKSSKISKKLKVVQEREKARGRIISQIKENFKKANIDVDVDGQSGDVILSFGKEYFDTGRANLKPEMKEMLQKFIPVYAKSLFQDKKVANKIESVEIIGYASPTYKGRYVDPASLSRDDKEAVNYNMDLSYRRAKSIFNHIFDKDKMAYEKQKDLLPLVKVTGKSFLAEAKRDRGVASGTSVKNFCKTYDCKKAQKVIIKFNLNND